VSAAPRVLLVTDADLSPGSRGAGRTLVNLFSRYPADRFLALSSGGETTIVTTGGHRVLPAAHHLPGRITKALRPHLGHVDAAWVLRRPLPHRAEIARFAPELVVAVPTHPVGIALAEQCRHFAPLVMYLMDDWLAFEPGVRLAFDAREIGRELLRRAVAWLSISPYLSSSLRAFAGVERPTHLVHNAVPIGDVPPAALSAPRAGRFRVGYAGSVWPMHWDALAAVVQSVQRLRDAGADIEFVLYTDGFFWGRHASEWRRWGVVNGGLVPYESLFETLGECDLLLVASAFDRTQSHMSRSSLQTKVTDYMAVGRPILACGPSDSASNKFLRQHDCAYFAEDLAPAAVDAALRACMDARATGPALAARAWEAARRDHELVAVTDRLYAFLGDAARLYSVR
jgi:glycosyltransferase involved in cell wall biosynthesis